MDLIDGLEANGLLKHYSHILTGYVRSKDFLHAISDVIEKVKKYNPDVKYVCDPVMGDNGKFYCPKELVDAYKRILIPKAFITTPN